ncbi:Pentatricopeptide repeat-containing protein [Striga hermonthica]|uniref:Pentatricopeptide repeat-containing protein n=1 Tax=Striga hermonthica TaxID=68872 RepID=A0A9N7N5A0_STRHE|nr:Pentatricopeptide repeat-containing protein [Striga hermonthica]
MRFGARRVASHKIFSTALFHGHAGIESPYYSSPASTLWFVKVVCTILIRHTPSLAVFNTDYFRDNLNPFVAFSVVYHITSRLNNPDLAFNFFRYSRLSLNLVHSQSTFDLLLRSLCKMGLHDSAQVVYGYMKADGLSLGSSVVEFMISSFANARKFQAAEEILVARAEFCNGRGERVSPFVYNNLLTLLMNKNLVDEAVTFFRNHVLRLRSLFPETCTFNIVIRGLCRAGNVDRAFEVFHAMRSFACHPDHFTYNTLVNGLCRVGKVDRAETFVREVKAQSGFSPDVVTYTSIISGYCKSGKMEDASALLDDMIDNDIRPNLFTFNAIIDGYGKKGEVALAAKTYERMVGNGVDPDVVTFTSLIDGYCRCGELEKGRNLFEEMNNRKVPPNVFTFSILISALCRENRLNEARDLLRQLKWREDIVPPPFVYNPIVDGFCKGGNVDEANAIVSEMEAKGCTHDKMTFTILILGHCMKGRMSEAIVVYNKMLSVGCAPDNITINSLVSCLRKAGMAPEANEIEHKALNCLHSRSSSAERTNSVRNNMNVTVAVYS